jgi:hypothetical protein
LWKHVIANEKAAAPDQGQRKVHTFIFTGPGISEHQIERLLRLGLDELQPIRQLE